MNRNIHISTQQEKKTLKKKEQKELCKFSTTNMKNKPRGGEIESLRLNTNVESKPVIAFLFGSFVFYCLASKSA